MSNFTNSSPLPASETHRNDPAEEYLHYIPGFRRDRLLLEHGGGTLLTLCGTSITFDLSDLDQAVGAGKYRDLPICPICTAVRDNYLSEWQS